MFLSIVNHSLRSQVLKDTCRVRIFVTQLRSCVSLLIDNRLQVKFGTCNTKRRIKFGPILIVPMPTIIDKEPSSILTLKFPRLVYKLKTNLHTLSCDLLHPNR